MDAIKQKRKGQMPGMFKFSKFSDIDLTDSFFDSLKSDYPANKDNIGFENWFLKKSEQGATALIFNDEVGIGAFICLKDEEETLDLVGKTLPKTLRKKISTFRIAERYRGQRIGEGAIGLILWHWQKSLKKEIYVTVFPKHIELIDLLTRFGFSPIGQNKNGESVYLKSRENLDYSNPYKAFPFLSPNFENAGYLVVNDIYHDTLFPYSELSKTVQEQLAISAANGVTKIYIGSPAEALPYKIGEPIFIYRRYTKKDGQKPGFKSCVTSYCILTDIVVAKSGGIIKMPLQDLIAKIGNKSVFDERKIKSEFETKSNLVILELLYCGFFGSGNNINWVWLKNNGLWSDGYPTFHRLSRTDFNKILERGKTDVSNVIINQPSAR